MGFKDTMFRQTSLEINKILAPFNVLKQYSRGREFAGFQGTAEEFCVLNQQRHSSILTGILRTVGTAAVRLEKLRQLSLGQLLVLSVNNCLKVIVCSRLCS